MSIAPADKLFAGPIPRLYEKYLVPMIFAPYATDIAQRAAAHRSTRVLEIAAGTGVVTRQLATLLPPGVAIVATDLNQPMLDRAAQAGTTRAVEWRQADALQLPFPDASFDVVVCQFGVMFFPDKSRAFAEARRVLKPGGVFIFNVWDRIEDNDFAYAVTQALAAVFPTDPPRFMARIPHGYHDAATISRDLRGGGFIAAAEISTVTARSTAQSPRIPAIAYCQGTPLRGEIEARDAARLSEATELATEFIARRFGRGAIDGKIQAHVVTVRR